MKLVKKKEFANGYVCAMRTEDDYPIEVTSTFLPYYTKDAIGFKQNKLQSYELGDRSERYMIGISVSSGCIIGCKFCATGSLKKFRNLSTEEIIQQVDYIVKQDGVDPTKSKEFKINYTRMGDFGLNTENVKNAITGLNKKYPNLHHYISTIGVKGSDFSWIKDNITLQLSLHSLDEDRRHKLIPFKNLMSIEELGQIRTQSNLKTTLNLTLVDEEDFDIDMLKKYFNPEYFFVKLSPINPSEASVKNNLGNGIIEGINLL